MSNINLPINHDKDTDLFCPECGHQLVIRSGKYAKFWGCSNYPQCRYTCSIDKGDRERFFYDNLINFDEG